MRIAFGAAALAVVLVTCAQAADQYPSRPIRVVVPYPAGGTVDTIARLVGAKASETAGQPFVIDNRGGAAGNIGSDNVAKSDPDGYTILQNVNSLSLSPSLFRKLQFDPLKDLAAVSQITVSPLLIVASAKTGMHTLQDLIVTAKQKPGALNFGSTGVGNPLHLTMEMFKAAAGVDIVHVPFKGDAPLLSSLIAGDVQVACVPFATTLPHIQAGTLRVLAVTTAQRISILPDAPTVAETFPGFVSNSWEGWFVPAATPRDIVMTINGYARTALQDSKVVETLKSFGNVPVGNSPEEFSAIFRDEVARFAKVVKDLNLPPQD